MFCFFAWDFSKDCVWWENGDEDFNISWILIELITKFFESGNNWFQHDTKSYLTSSQKLRSTGCMFSHVLISREPSLDF